MMDCCGAHKKFSEHCAECRYVRALEARTRTLEAALRGMLICDDRCKRPQCVQARAALTEPTPPKEEQGC